MAIRFQCGACSQPIEVDDEWASKPVTCPYCHKTVTAPAESTLDELPAPPASPIRVDLPAVGPDAEPIFAGPAAIPGNRLAVVAFGLALGAMTCLIAANIVAGPHSLEVQELMDMMRKSADEPAGYTVLTRYLEKHPDAQGWLMTCSLLAMLGLASSAAGVVCGVIATRRRGRRGLAVAALVIGLLPIFLLCCGGVLFR